MSKPIDPKELSQMAFGLYPHLFPGGEDTVDTESIAKRIQRIRQGWLPESEFFAFASWLGCCAAIHRIDQTPMLVPERDENLRAPDFLIFVRYKGQVIPLLVEVKTSEEPKLEWSEKYLFSLKRFAEILGLPLLLAWKWNNIWILLDHSHFQKKVTAYHLDFETAIQENLLGVLFDHWLIRLQDNVSFVMDAELLDYEHKSEYKIVPQGQYTLKMKGAGLRAGEEHFAINEVSPEIFFLMMSAGDDDELKLVSETAVELIYRPRENYDVQLLDLLFTLFYLRSKDEDRIPWDQIILEGPLKFTAQEFRDSFKKKESSKFIRSILQQIPNTMPAYLSEA
jgi:Holliday junction resolvase